MSLVSLDDKFKSKREPILDILRFLAAVLVFLYHMDLQHNFAGIFPPYFTSISQAGKVGVPIFFILSGFVIC
jgi:peptidoglycan/LPS O-acetylase OafA/YrhL